MKRIIILAALLIAAPLSAQDPPVDTARATADLTLLLPTGAIVVQGDTTIYRQDMTVNVVLEDRRAATDAAEQAGAEKVAGGYQWEARTALVLLGVFVYRYWKNGKAQFDITNDINLGDVFVDVDVDDDHDGHGRKGKGKGHKPGG